jgi:hypothetical protein
MKSRQLALLSLSALMVAVVPTAIATAQSPTQAAQVTQTAPAPAAQAQSVAIEMGTFVAGEAPTTGTARIVTEGGHHYVEIDAAFSTSSMGPDLHVLLDTTNRPPQSYDNMGSTINLGKLHNYTGAQRYPIPDVIDVASIKSVVIWCRMANATFGYAPLNPVTNARVQ